MKRSHYSAVGIDVGPRQVRIVKVRRQKKKILLTAGACCDLPEGTIEQGLLKDHEALVKALVRLKKKCRITSYCPIGLAVHGLTGVIQIVKIPKQLPGNISQFVGQEIKQCVAFAGRDILTDYCAVGGGRQTTNRVVGVGIDEMVIRQYVNACEQAHLSVDWLVPSYLGHVNTFYECVIAPCVNSNLLFLVVRGSTLQMGVFRNGALDFIRERDLESLGSDASDLAHSILHDVDTLMQYYDIEIQQDRCQWDLLLSMNAPRHVRDIVEAEFKTSLPKVQVNVLDEKTVAALLPVEVQPRVSMADISWTALGVALQGMAHQDQTMKINLMPQDILRVKQIKRQGLMTAAAAAVIFSVMGLTAYGFSQHTHRLSQELAQNNHDQEIREETIRMVKERLALEDRIEGLSAANQQLKKIHQGRETVPWADVLQEIRRRMPNNLWLQRLSTQREDDVLIIDGGSITWQAVKIFITELNKSNVILNAKSLSTELNRQQGPDYVQYRIRCQVKMVKEGGGNDH